MAFEAERHASPRPHPVPRTEDALTGPQQSAAASQHSIRIALQRAAASSPCHTPGSAYHPTLSCSQVLHPRHTARRAARARQARGEQECAPPAAGRAPRQPAECMAGQPVAGLQELSAACAHAPGHGTASAQGLRAQASAVRVFRRVGVRTTPGATAPARRTCATCTRG